MCPECDSSDYEQVSDNLYRCLDCHAYFAEDDPAESSWEPSARNRTRDKLNWDDDSRAHPKSRTWEDDV